MPINPHGKRRAQDIIDLEDAIEVIYHLERKIRDLSSRVAELENRRESDGR